MHVRERHPLLKVEELADELNVPTTWVYKKSAEGSLPSVRVGRYLRFDLDEVMAWLRGDE